MCFIVFYKLCTVVFCTFVLCRSMLIDFLSAVFNHFYETMLNDQNNVMFTTNSIEVVNPAVQEKTEISSLTNSTDSVIEHSCGEYSSSGDVDLSNAVGSPNTVDSSNTVGSSNVVEKPIKLVESPSVIDFINDDTAMHEIALFVHYLQYSF